MKLQFAREAIFDGMNRFFTHISFLGILLLTSCNWAENKTKQVLNKSGELAGSAATEVLEGVTTGVERTWKVDVQLSAELREKGLQMGRTVVLSDAQGRSNRLKVYLSTDVGMQDTLSAIAFDKDSLEMGRTTMVVNAGPNSGDHYELLFQEDTDLERKSRVLIR